MSVRVRVGERVQLLVSDGNRLGNPVRVVSIVPRGSRATVEFERDDGTRTTPRSGRLNVDGSVTLTQAAPAQDGGSR